MWPFDLIHRRCIDRRRIEDIVHRLAYAAQNAAISLHVEDPNDTRPSTIMDGWFVDGVQSVVDLLCRDLSIDLPKEGVLGYITEPDDRGLPFSMRPRMMWEIRRLASEVERDEGTDQMGEAPSGADRGGGSSGVPGDGEPVPGTPDHDEEQGVG